MDTLQALLLGLLQGLTEYLPVSSSGHLALGSYLFGITDPETILPFTVLLHVATVLSTLVVLRKEVFWLFKGLFRFKDPEGSPKRLHGMNSEQSYVLNILISMIPIAIVGLCFKDQIEAAFNGLVVVGVCLLVTAALLTFSSFAQPRKKENITRWDAFVIGIAQACACLPGLSRSGSTIATGLMLGARKERIAQFSFLMVIPPILGEALLDAKDVVAQGVHVAFAGIEPSALIVGFLAAFLSGCMACKWMINLVKKGKLVYFAIYCAILGVTTLIFACQ